MKNLPVNMKWVYRSSILLPVLIFFVHCNNDNRRPAQGGEPAAKANPDTAIKGEFNSASGIHFDSTELQDFLKKHPLLKEFGQEYSDFYRMQKFNYVWFDSNGLIETAHALMGSVYNQEAEGLKNKVVYADELDQFLQAPGEGITDSLSGGPNLGIELLLTGQYFTYAQRVFGGVASDKAPSLDWYLPRKKLSYTGLLESYLSGKDLTKIENQTQIPQYNALKKELQRYRQLEQQPSSPPIPLIQKKRSLKPGDTSSIVPLVRKKLMELGLMKEASDTNRYDQSLAEGVKLFKRTHGLNEDSLISNEVINEMNVPLKKRIVQILANLERFRWVPGDSTQADFIFVNIPNYTLQYYQNGSEAWRCNVVVGKPMTQTVIFSGRMKYVVFSPYWNVPPSIIKKEIMPGMKRNKNYLAAHNMEWNGGKVRQKPGPSNSLGLVKFLFPNSNNIYLHDSPAKSLFKEDVRAFSHGCIRVARPKDLAMRVLRDDSSWAEEKIDQAMHAGKEKWVTLKKTIPVYIGYFTAFVDKDGYINFRKDIYNRDERLAEMIME